MIDLFGTVALAATSAVDAGHGSVDIEIIIAILIPLSCTVLGVFLHTQSKKRWTGWEKYNALKEATELDAKIKLDATLTCLRAHLNELNTAKLDKTEYEKHHNAIVKRVNDHAHIIVCASKECTARETGKVIITEK